MQITSLPQGVHPNSTEAWDPLHAGVHRVETILAVGGHVTAHLVSKELSKHEDEEGTLLPHWSWEYHVEATLGVDVATYSSPTTIVETRHLRGLKQFGGLNHARLSLIGEPSEEAFRSLGLARMALLVADHQEQPLSFHFGFAENLGTPIDTTYNDVEEAYDLIGQNRGALWVKGDPRVVNESGAVLLLRNRCAASVLKLAINIMAGAGVEEPREKLAQALRITTKQLGAIQSMADMCKDEKSRADVARKILAMAKPAAEEA